MGKGLAFLSPWLIGFFVFTLVPVLLSLYYSLCDYTLLQKPVFIGATNYQTLYNDPVFWKALGNTFKYALLALPAAMVVSLGLALLLNADIKGQAIYRTIIFLPSLVPAVASAMLWLWLFNAQFGLINLMLGKIGIPGPPWLGNEKWALPALAFMSLWGVGQTVVIYLAGLQDVPKELYEAAELDGANPWQRLRNVTIPMISPVIFFNLIMAIIGTMQVFTQPFIMTQGGPARATYMFTYYLYDNAFTFMKMGYASAMAWVQLLIIVFMNVNALS